MLSLNTLSVVLAFSSSVLAWPTFGLRSSRDATFKSSIVAKLNGPPAGWEKDDSAKVNKDIDMVKLRIHLVQQGMSDFHDVAMKVLKFFTCSHVLYNNGRATLFEGGRKTQNSLLDVDLKINGIADMVQSICNMLTGS